MIGSYKDLSRVGDCRKKVRCHFCEMMVTPDYTLKPGRACCHLCGFPLYPVNPNGRRR